jgi:small subunit ribosomal protein S1
MRPRVRKEPDFNKRSNNKSRKVVSTMSNVTMDSLMASSTISTLAAGQILDAKIISIKKNKAWLDLGPFGLGQVTRKEVGAIGELKPGDTVQACVVEPDLDHGYSLLSLRATVKEKGWEEFEALVTDGTVLEVSATDVNKGGLIIEYGGVRGFMPVSQLGSANYPKLNRGADNTDAIIEHLKSLIGKKLKAKVITADKNLGKLIFSEKEASKEQFAEKLKSLTVGKRVSGVVTGVTSFGVFVDVDGIEGLVHISEMSWSRVEDPNALAKKGDQVDAEVVSVDQDRLSLSMKKLIQDPWQEEASKLKSGDTIKGTVTRITPFGAFVSISPTIEALVHITEIEDNSGSGKDSKAEQVLQLGQESTFKVADVDLSSKRISLSIAK